MGSDSPIFELNKDDFEKISFSDIYYNISLRRIFILLKKMRKKAGALLVMICLGVIILLCWEAGEHLKDKILRSLETAAEARTGKQTVVLDSGHGGSDSGKVGSMGRKKRRLIC